ncbi:hypothetical protein AAG570_004420 [Ranatra chinensis]|uniref:Ig-like domain-containing protein n=1 Tax=Ranatra chinensis TaxID=642074 RepID=A0ABD0Y0S6_9HEMI
MKILLHSSICLINYSFIPNADKQESGEAPKFVQPLKPKVARPKETTHLTCRVTGKPTPDVKWYRRQEEIVEDEHHRLEYNRETGETTLTIEETTEIDETIYSVRATNKFGTAECRANLVLSEVPQKKLPELTEAPRITKPLEAKVIPKGTTVTLDVEFTGVPQPTVRWYRNGKEITETEEITVETNRTTIILKKVTKKTAGKYEVRVMNSAGEARTSGSVTIIEKEEITEMEGVKAPRFIKPLKPKIVSEGEVVIMEAEVESYPTCSFQWFIHDTPIKVGYPI